MIRGSSYLFVPFDGSLFPLLMAPLFLLDWHRYAGDLEAALRSLVLHILIGLVALGDDAPSSVSADEPGGAADCSGGGPTAALLGEYADELLVSFQCDDDDHEGFRRFLRPPPPGQNFPTRAV